MKTLQTFIKSVSQNSLFFIGTNVPDKICRGNYDIIFYSKSCFRPVAPFVRKCGKIRNSQIGRRLQYNTGQRGWGLHAV